MSATEAEAPAALLVADWAYKDFFDVVPTAQGMGARSCRELAGDPVARLDLHKRVKTLRDPFACQILRAVPAPAGFVLPCDLVITQDDIEACCVFAIGPFEKRARRDPVFTPKDGDQVHALYADWCEAYKARDAGKTTDAETLLTGAGYLYDGEIEAALTRAGPEAFYMLPLDLIPHSSVCCCARCKKTGFHMVEAGRQCTSPGCTGTFFYTFGGVICYGGTEAHFVREAPPSADGLFIDAMSLASPAQEALAAECLDALRSGEIESPFANIDHSPTSLMATITDTTTAEAPMISFEDDVAPAAPSIGFDDDPAPAAEPVKKGRKKKAADVPAAPSNGGDLSPTTMTFKGQSAATLEKANLEVDQAKVDLQRAEWEKFLAEAEGSFDRALVQASLDGRDDGIAAQIAQVEHEKALASIANALPAFTPEFAAYAAIRIKKAGDERERVTREATVMMERARRRESTAEFLLREKLETWARAQPRDGKTVRLPGTTHKIVFKDQEAHFEIQKEGDVVKYVLEDLGEAAAISRAVVKKKFDLLKSNLVTVFCPGGAAKEIPGATFVPKGENPVIFRK